MFGVFSLFDFFLELVPFYFMVKVKYAACKPHSFLGVVSFASIEKEERIDHADKKLCGIS